MTVSRGLVLRLTVGALTHGGGEGEPVRHLASTRSTDDIEFVIKGFCICSHDIADLFRQVLNARIERVDVNADSCVGGLLTAIRTC